VSCLIPKEVGHINSVQSVAFSSTEDLLRVAAFAHSLVADFYVKATGRSNLHSTWENFPLLNLDPRLVLRVLMLNCLTGFYAKLWAESWNKIFRDDMWAKKDERLNNRKFAELSAVWQPHFPLRSDFERRQALLEIDVLVAMALGLTLEELKAIYLMQFPVLHKNEKGTFFDARGQIVFTNNSQGLRGVGVPSDTWERAKEWRAGALDLEVTEDFSPEGSRSRTRKFVAPFDKCDREQDYNTVWREFERRLGGKMATVA